MIPAAADRYRAPGARTIATSAAGLLLLLLLVPFVWTGHVQEDAYITFRCAMNLADTGVYGFNPGLRVSASTSHLSVFIAAAARLLFGRAFIPAVQLAYGAAAIAGIRLLTASLVADERDALLVWIAVASLPASLMAAYSGMETGLLLLLAGLAVQATTVDRCSGRAVLAFAMLPWVRPDAVAIGVVVLFVMAAIECRSLRRVAIYASCLAGGTAGWAAFNRIYFGSALTQTIAGKAAVWLPGTFADAVRWGVVRERLLMFGGDGTPGLFVPIATKYLTPFSLPCAVAVCGAIAAAILRPSRFAVRRRPATALALIALVVPAAYAVGGVVYPWYLWPSQIAGSLIAVALISGWLHQASPRVRHTVALAGTAALVALVAGQWVFAAAWGTEERLYRGGIGEQIKSLAAPGDTLLLEPAGYIPFYAGLRTWDEIGLASPEVTSYRRNYGRQWWIRFVVDHHPTFLVERQHMLEHRTLDGYPLSDDEQRWFDRHYVLVRRFDYVPDALRSSRLLARIARLGSARTYLLYRFSV